MLIVITTPHLSLSDLALLEAAVLKDAEQEDVTAENVQPKKLKTKIILCGDGVYAPGLHSNEFDALLAPSGTPVVAIRDDVLSRGVKTHSAIQLIDNKIFAALSTHHQQWVTF
ncbi:hypothetical protein KUL42_33120 [Alteromonas sp. KUL42]|nr:hypothetical protein KUL42_33120 [Alteromonas sp. KUL42]